MPRLFVTARTVESHVKQVFLKLNLDVNAESHLRVLAVLAYLLSDFRRDPGAGLVSSRGTSGYILTFCIDCALV